MAELTIQEVVEGGLEATYASATGGGDYFTPTSNEPHVIHIVNGGASPITVEVNDPTSTSPAGAQSFDPDLGVTVTNAESRFILVLPARCRTPKNPTPSPITAPPTGSPPSRRRPRSR